MGVRDRRKEIRITQYLRAKLAKAGLPEGVEGEAENLGHGGASVRTPDWRSFKVKDRTVVTLCLPQRSPAGRHRPGCGGGNHHANRRGE
jgi:hypothetical protein